MKMSESIAELAKALAVANKTVSNPQKNATNPHFKNKYATLDAVIEAYKSSYLENGITVLENPVTQDGAVGVSITLLHESGQYITHDPFMLPPGKNTAQGYGSSITYARRYALSAVMNIAADEDDDGNGASSGQQNNNQQGAPSKASDKQLNFVTNMIQKRTEDKDERNKIFQTMAQSVGLPLQMDQWTSQQASAAIKYLNGD